MNGQKIRVGLVGANSTRGWASRSHLPAIAASRDFELVAACTTSSSSARETAERYGAAHAVTDVAALVGLPDVDLVVVSVRAPLHFAAVATAINGGKPVLCEWPVGKSTTETAELNRLAQEKGVRSFSCLQGRMSAEIQWAKDLIASGGLGHLLSASMIGNFPHWGSSMPPGGDYLADAANGATFLSIICGHSLDMLEFLIGHITTFAAQVDNRFPETLSASGITFAKTSPDRLCLSGQSSSDIPVTVLLEGGVPGNASFMIEVQGTGGLLRISTNEVPEILPPQIAFMPSDGEAFETITVPRSAGSTPAAALTGAAPNIACFYDQVAKDLRTGTSQAPDFAHGENLHHLLDEIAQASDRRVWRTRVQAASTNGNTA